jgi:hypothetical protein
MRCRYENVFSNPNTAGEEAVMRTFGRIVFLLFVLTLSQLIGGCDAPPEGGLSKIPQDYAIDGLTTENLIVEVSTSTSVVYYPGCKPDGMIVEAYLQQHPEGIKSVVLSYRLHNTDDDISTPWNIVAMLPDGILNDLERYGVELSTIGADSMTFLQGDAGVIEYKVMAEYEAGMSAVWPGENAEPAQIPVEICVEGSWDIIDYGPDVEKVYYTTFCKPNEVTFSIIVEKAFLVDSGWLQYQYLAPSDQAAGVSPLLTVPLSPTVPAPGYPDATLFSATIDVAAEAPGYMQGQSGYMAWNMYLQNIFGGTYEFPQGGPPTVEISHCLSFSAYQASTDLFYYKQSDCRLSPNEINLQVSVNDPSEISLVEVYFRVKIKETGETTEWDSRVMRLASDNSYHVTLNAESVQEGAFPLDAWLQYQFVMTTKEGAVIRSEVFGDVSLETGCPVILDRRD